MTLIVDATAIATYSPWGAMEVVPSGCSPLIALTLVLSVNMISVKWFGEFEFWAALMRLSR